MTRATIIGGGAVAALLGLGALAFAVLVVTSATPAAHVQRYLDALARDDLVAAAHLAGLEPPTAMPVGDAGEPSIHRVVSSDDAGDGTVVVTAEYGDETDAALVTFALQPAPPIFGLVPAWAFVTPPVGTLTVTADQHDVIAINGQSFVATAAGEPVDVSVFVPARVSVRVDEPLVSAPAQTVRIEAIEGTPPVTLAVEPTDRLQRIVTNEITRLLGECAEQRVLQPAGCPFGITIVDRVVEPPLWRLDQLDEVTIEPGNHPGRWSVRSEGSVQLIVDVQRLFDGTVTSRDDLIGFIVRGEVTIIDRQPEVRLFSAES
ncbi:hypothetical protein [Microcella sp.]|uniref:hypothetical protein n=1 Tax=Microcella sp. TaxID=1913979 RepID=UPI00299F7CA5|nr:hypothetical protein [Microcella sp.]MDX2026954.1 hypothetical protein [Microcella sp.]